MASNTLIDFNANPSQTPRFKPRLASLKSRGTHCRPEIGGAERTGPLNYDHIFDQAIRRLHAEGRYRVFIEILRNKGSFPDARCFAGHNGPKPITVWCSNDYLRSEEHTSELQSLMRISYAVFCLKKKTNKTMHNTYYHNIKHETK